MIRFFTAHPTAANLVMILLLAMGFAAAPTIVRSTFPPLPLDLVQVSIPYPGAAPDEVEESVCRRLEDALDRVNQVKEVVCEARENVAIAQIEAEEGVITDRFVSDVRTEVDAIDDFPDAIESPIIRLLGTTEPVVSIAVFGDMPYPALKDAAEDLKRRLKRLEGVGRVTVNGFTDRQLRVELDLVALRALGLGVDDITTAIRSLSLDMPAGDIETVSGYLTIRLDDERTAAASLRELIVYAGNGGGEIRLGEIASIKDTFRFENQRMTFDGLPAAILGVEKNRQDDALEIMARISEFVEQERQSNNMVQLELTRDVASLVRDRLGMLITNGIQGLLLVMLILWLFFSARHAFWVAVGLPVSFAGAFALMSLFGYQFDMMTLVALLVAIGILVDDAIVVSENIAVHRENGKDPLTASVDGAKEVFPGVFASFITTACIFTPLAFLRGDLGAVLKVVPVVILMTLIVSFIEAFLILPAHLQHSKADTTRNRVQRRLDEILDRTRDHIAFVWVDRMVRWRYLFFGSLIAVLLMTISLITSGTIGFTPLPELDNETIEARILLPQGTASGQTESTVDTVLAGLAEVNRKLSPEQPDGQPLVRHVTVQYGTNIDAHETGDHVATVSVDLLDPEVRSRTSSEIRKEWRDAVGTLPDVIFLKYADPMIGPQGKALDLRILGDDLAQLRMAAESLLAWLRQYRGVYDLSTDLRPGKPEVRIRLKPGAQELGINSLELAQQLRGAFFGLTASKIQVGDESFDIDVTLNDAARADLDTLDGFMVSAPTGQLVPLTAVADLEPSRGFARINRIDSRRAVSIEGLIDQRQTTSAAVLDHMTENFLPQWQRLYPDVELEIAGESEQAATTFGSMQSGLLLGSLAVFLLLSFQFRSYIEPVVVMVIIPLSLIGVVLGHVLFGYNLTMPSMLGLVSLAGIVVNDSILLVTFVESRLSSGMSLHDAVVNAAHDRFRAILLTSVTTVAGLLPLLLETSMQAKVVIPLALSLAFGLTSATLFVLFVIPAFYMVLHDFGLFHRHDELTAEVSETPTTPANFGDS